MSAAAIFLEFDPAPLIAQFGPKVELALIRALNRTADRDRTRAARAVRDQINFPASYVSPSSNRLWVKTRARKGALETMIEGRGTPTSLARFSRQSVLPGGSRHTGGRINVTVKPGQTKSIGRAFIIRLKNNNIGLAVRTTGAAPANAYRPKAIGKNLWLLYGPSVDQALSAASSERGIFEEMTPASLDFLETEFTRQLELLENA
ncbi:phage tail protein [Mesorhizobium sp. AR07]|uniref:phage tail protein n=1 Tax=Mesorhizobium sp. AR07 TaxID=2865838 RepID=UPI00215ECAB1|nr:phage tail protein [Mesorhizobium sp. AR07]UVK46821.1 phage tail protein [Mesorhizobium sp. AR07]